MAKIKGPGSVRCMVCGKRYKTKDALIDHIDRTHATMIPEGWSARRYECYLRTGKVEGHCIYCNTPTEFNEVTGKYHRLCKNPKCRKKCSDNADKNMIGVYGKTTLMDDPEFQRKAVYSRKTAGIYTFEDPDDPSIKYEVGYDSSYGKDFLEMLDCFLYMSGQDIIGPSPHTYWYEYEGKKHFYIPDFYIVSLGLEVEIKDGGDNPNRHPDIIRVAKVKEALKDRVMESLRDVRYIKVVNKDYTNFFALLSELKEQDTVYIPKWAEPNAKYISVTEGLDELLEDLPVNNDVRRKYAFVITATDENVVSYEKAIDSLMKELVMIKRPHELALFRDKADKYYNYLGKVANNNREQGESAQKDAIRARKKMNETLYPKLEEKERRFEAELKRREKSAKVVIEGAALNPNLKQQLFVSKTDLERVQAGYEGSWENVRFPIWVCLWDTKTLGSKVIKSFTHDPYNHASIAISPYLRPMFSFNMEKHGFNLEDIDHGWYGDHANEIRYSIYVYMADAQEYLAANNAITNFYDNVEKFKYHMMGLVEFFSKNKHMADNARICSEFCAEILQACDPKIAPKRRDAYAPYDLSKLKRLVHCQRGLLKNFNHLKLIEDTKKKAKEGGYEIWVPNLKITQDM